MSMEPKQADVMKWEDQKDSADPMVWVRVGSLPLRLTLDNAGYVQSCAAREGFSFEGPFDSAEYDAFASEAADQPGAAACAEVKN